VVSGSEAVETKLKHFDINDWADYVRQVGDVTKREGMTEHLRTCHKCEQTVAFLRKVVAVTAADTRSVPDQLVRNAKAMFAMAQPQKLSHSSIIANLIFDSFRQPLPEGVRGQQRVTRQAMYEAGDYCVDLRMEHERGGALVTLIGQVASRKNPGLGVSGTPVMLMSGQDVVARASCNQYGEFQMEYRPQQHIRLQVPVAEENRWIEVRLHELNPENTGEEPASDADFGGSGKTSEHN
jgi:hypothetical protein